MLGSQLPGQEQTASATAVERVSLKADVAAGDLRQQAKVFLSSPQKSIAAMTAHAEQAHC